MLVNFVKMIEELRNESSSKNKQAILEKYKGDNIIKTLLEETYNPFKKFGLTEKVFDNIERKDGIVTTFEITLLLSKLSSSNINDSLREEARELVSKLPDGERKAIIGVICKDLKIGVGVKTINKVFKNLVPEFGVQLAITLDKAKLKENDEIWITEKFDGIRCICLFKKDRVNFYSRNGKEILGMNDLKQSIKQFAFYNNIEEMVFDGELVKENVNNIDSGELYRETVSIVNSKNNDKKGIVFNIFDAIGFNDFKNGVSIHKYSIRRRFLDCLKNVRYIRVTPVLYYGTDHSVINEILEKIEDDGKEGLMINLDDYYYTKRSKSLIKVKSFLTCECRVTGVIEGTGRNIGKLGAIMVEFVYKDKTYSCEVGSGFSDINREIYWNNKDMIMNKIVEIKYFEVSKNKAGEVSLRFPIWIDRIRTDKEDITIE